MNIRDLENFYNISQYKSFSFASKMLGVTQPTLSESIKRLEKDIGTQLFYRSKAGIKLTPKGEQTLSHVIRLLNIKNEIETVSKEHDQINQTFKVGCHAVVAGYFLTSFLQTLHKSYENVTVNFQHDHSRSVQTLIQDGNIDLGVVVNPIRNPDLIIKKLCDDKICIWQATKSSPRTDQFIADMGLSQVQAILRSWSQTPFKHISTTDFHLIGELAESGIGYGILPEKFVRQKKLKLKQVFPKAIYKDELALVYRPEFGKNEVEAFLVKSLIQSFKK
ncbi:hypothetical protein A9Q84_16375 [Halobacteriovorax marinus]|uniref:HTH lysR-type domain-containing protein n=1 Tax=Halobacteriovorax marinus TaxID=97084 RepID=A0A1Y5F9R7_9BACT|nr:hypothetical protein A9Q84_16375 [Halobacteriovorax marinus]